ncbi:MAG: cytochrome B6 [Deferribacterota bacterium]|nr:cytochrome B6 [Deferribacterota bacterium]
MEKERKHIKSDPYFFKIIKYSSLFLIALILICSIFFDAPLMEKADIKNPPNPAKSAWFLLWIQEVVSYSIYYIYIVLIIFIFYLFLPLIRKNPSSHLARWFPKEDLLVSIFTILIIFIIIILTIIAYFFRGHDWILKFY